jgi:Flp pilus assembly protein TadB
MATLVVVLLVIVAAAVLFALAWWSSGRSRRQFGSSVSEREVAKGMGTLEGMRREPPGTHGGGVF